MDDNKNEISISDLLNIIFKNFYIILITLIITIAIGSIYILEFQDKVYESTTSVMVDPLKFTSNNSNDLTGGIEASESVAKWFKEILILDEVATNINNTYNTTYSSSDISDMLSTKYTSSDIFVYLKCTNKDPLISKAIANEVIKVSLQLSNGNYNILQDAYLQVSLAKDGKNITTSPILILIISCIVGLLIGCSSVFILYFVKNQFVKVDQIQSETKLNILGTIYDDESNKKYHESILGINRSNYNKLLTNIDFSNVDGLNKTITITSSIAKEGKSTTIINLAKTIAENGKKVLIIDCDLRCPRIHRYLNLTSKKGISEYITNQANKEEIIINQGENLDVICAGGKTPNPIIILQSKKLNELLEESKNSYDYILIDTPPMLVSADAMLVADKTDSLIYVVALNKTSISNTKHSVQTLRQNNISILGCCATYVKEKINKYEYEYYNN